MEQTLIIVLEHWLMLLLEAELKEEAEVEKWEQTEISVSVSKKKGCSLPAGPRWGLGSLHICKRCI